MTYSISFISWLFFSIPVFLGNNNYSYKETASTFYNRNVKCVVIYYHSRSSIPSANKDIVIYIDNLNNKELVIAKSTIGDTIKKQTVLKIDSVQYMMSDTIQCIRAKRKKNFSLDNLDFSLLNEETKNSYGITNYGDVIWMGRHCIKYTMNSDTRKLKGEIIVWENIPLKIVIENNGQTEITETYKIETNVTLSVNIFNIPSGIEILDLTSIENN